MISILIAAASMAADAQPAPVPPMRTNVRMSRTVILPSVERQPDVVSAQPEEMMWKADLGVEDVAELRGSVHVAAGGLSRSFNPSSELWRAEPTVQYLDYDYPFRGRLYCGVRIEGTDLVDKGEIMELIFRTNDWERSDRRLCLLDEDEDGAFDHAVAAGKIKQGPTVVAIQPTPYTTIHDMRLRNASIQFRPIKGAILQGPQIELDGYANGSKVGSVRVHVIRPGQSKFSTVIGERSIPKATFPSTLDFGEMKIIVTAYDGSSRTVTAQLDKGFYRTPVYFEGPGPTVITVYVPH